MLRQWLTVGLLVAGWAVAHWVWADGQIGLFEGLASGQIRAQFRGNGDSSILGRLWSTPEGPDKVILEAGTQFWAQLGGRQGMGLMGRHTIDLGKDRFAQFTLPTCCTNFGLREPRRLDVLLPEPCPDPRVALIASLGGGPDVHHAALQIAIWAVTSNPELEPVRKYADKMASKLRKTEGTNAPSADALFAEAAELLRKANLQPATYQIFRTNSLITPALVPLK